ncbi:LPS assembly lipoprotein LptE [Neptunomonas antarctica]|uniref:LPS-assembly lipoprotein LptE n=1 Tax=Neptunomonas antarctica TaxID=619304 RepID=A0A1N7J803_9GAMM|nr:LPS assembly lipoprotein LptE [Neptunomonas antarctica]SIS45366.1 Outer membrane lipoprotein LptE/RlpB (LPS assembly) [Neptunomonas antarctica]
MTLYRFLNRFVCFTLAAVLVSGCGFKLRGAMDIPESARLVTLVLKSGTSLPFEQALKRTLRQQDITLQAAAPYQLAITQVLENRRSITLDSDANVDEYELLLLVKFEVLNGKGESISGPLVARTERIYDYNANAATASYSLEKEIREEMWGSIAERIVRQYVAQTR